MHGAGRARGQSSTATGKPGLAWVKQFAATRQGIVFKMLHRKDEPGTDGTIHPAPFVSVSMSVSVSVIVSVSLACAPLLYSDKLSLVLLLFALLYLALLSPPTMHLRSDLSFQPLPPAVCLSNDKLPSLADVEAFSSAFHVHPPGPAIRLRLRLSFFRDFTSAHDDAALPSSQTHGTVVIHFVGRNPHHWQTVAVPLSALSFVDVSLF